MTSQRKSARPRRTWIGFALAAGLSAAPALAAAAPLDLFYERTVMTEANARCGLFEPAIGAALNAGRAQARGAALRSGVDKATLVTIRERAERKVAAQSCGSADLALAAQRVRDAYAGYAQMSRMTYPGDVSRWEADRASGKAARWRLQQSVAFGPDRMIFGLAGREGANALLAVAQFADGHAPYAARLIIRDVEATRGPYLDARGLSLANLPLARRLPPEAAQSAFAAEARSRAGADLAPKYMPSAWAFRFPAEAAQALAALDPREAVAVEFLFEGAGRSQARRAYVEVGDFAAGRAFLQVAGR
jgi:hypothetical protein